MKKALIVIVVIAILGLGAFVIFKKPTNKNNQNSNNSNSQTSSSTSSTGSQTAKMADNNAPVAATITYSNSGFSPATTTVKSGDAVMIKNTSSRTMDLDSDPHPTHTDDPDLNVGQVDPGQSKTFIVTQKGSYGYHNHLNPSETGNVVIQ